MTALDDAVDALAASVEVAQRLYGAAYARATEDAEDANRFGGRRGSSLTAHDMRDSTGRPYLLDAHTHLLTARVALVNAEIVRQARQ